MAEPSAEPRSALALELTATHARAFLIERTSGRARLVAAGESLATAYGPTADVVTGARAAIAQIETIAGRPLYGLGGAIAPRLPDGAGVDAVSLVVDARPRVAVVTFGDHPAAASAVRALESIDAVHREPIDVDSRADPAALADALRVGGPLTAIVLVGPGDGPAFARLASALGSSVAPLIWSGVAAGAELARATFGLNRAELRVVPPVRPSAQLEHLAPTRAAVLECWRARLEETLPGAETCVRWAGTGATPRRRGDELALSLLARMRGVPVWLARCEAGEATILCADPRLPTCVGARAVAAMPAASDMSAPAWLPPLRPGWVPDTAAEAAESRERCTALLQSAAALLPLDRRPARGRGAGLVIAAGDLAMLGAEHALRAVIDGLGPTGAVQLSLDELGGLSAIGGCGAAAPRLAAGVLMGDLLRPLGALVAPGWRYNGGRAAFRVRVAAIGQPDQPIEVAPEETRRLRLVEGQVATIRVERPAWWDIRRYLGRKVRLEAEGGPLGLLLDARARTTGGPLSLGREPIEDDAGAPRLLADTIVRRPIVAGPIAIRRLRRVSTDGRILVGSGDAVGPDELIGQRVGAARAAHEVIPAGARLGVRDPRPYLVRPAGATVTAGETIARRRLLFGLIARDVTAPVDGVLSTELGGFGNLAIVASSSGEGIAAHLPGSVVAALPGHGVTIESAGGLVSGVVGFGPERRGALLPPQLRLEPLADGRSSPAVRDCVVVLDVLDRRQYDALRSLGAAGAIVGSVEPTLAVHLLAERESTLAIVATEGIGSAPMCAVARGALAAREGGLACLSPGDPTDPRAAPEVVLPIAATSRTRPLADAGLAVGVTVRVVDGRVACGRVAALLSEPLRFGSGALTRGAEVELETGDRVRVPVANLELIA